MAAGFPGLGGQFPAGGPSPPVTQNRLEVDGVAYEFVKVLGKGSFGMARLFKRVSDHRPFVCKTVEMSPLNAEERRDARNEVTMLSKIRHPNIIGYVSSVERDDVLYIMMEYANAGDVDSLIKYYKNKIGAGGSNPSGASSSGTSAGAGGKAYISESMIGSLFVQMCHAIQYLHDRRILHRDLKAQNVFLSRSRPDGPLVVKIGDFGISTVLRNTQALAKTVCGTPYYFSPELCMSKPYNNKTDVWSLGCILYELCTLKHAFDASNLKALAQRILKGNYAPIPSQYSRDATKVLEGMLQIQVAKRWDIKQVINSSFVQMHAMRMCEDAATKTLSTGLALPEWMRAAREAVQKNQGRYQAMAPGLEKLDDLRTRVEMTTYEEQQRKVEQAKNVILTTQQAQMDRRGLAERQQQQLEELKSQMDAIYNRMRTDTAAAGAGGGDRGYNIPTTGPTAQELAKMYRNRVSEDAPWNQARDIPVGFTKETWEEHRLIQQKAAGLVPAPPPSAPRAPPPVPSSSALPPIHQQRYRPTAAQLPELPQPSRQMPVDEVFHGARPLADFDIDSILANQRQKRDQSKALGASLAGGGGGGGDAFQRLWEEQKSKIREASGNNEPTMTEAEMNQKLEQQLRRPQVKVHGPASPPTRPPASRDDDDDDDESDDEDENDDDGEYHRVIQRVAHQQAGKPKKPAVASPSKASRTVGGSVFPVVGGDVDDFEEAPLPQNDITRLTNVIKFKLDGKTLNLPNVSAEDPLSARVEALSEYLYNAFGSKEVMLRIKKQLVSIQESEMDDEAADLELELLEKKCGAKAKFVDLIVQLIVCENMMFQQQQ